MGTHVLACAHNCPFQSPFTCSKDCLTESDCQLLSSTQDNGQAAPGEEVRMWLKRMLQFIAVIPLVCDPVETLAGQQTYHHPPWCSYPLLLLTSVAWLQVQMPRTLPGCCQIAEIVALWRWLHPRAERHPADVIPEQPAYNGPEMMSAFGNTVQRSQNWHRLCMHGWAIRSRG